MNVNMPSMAVISARLVGSTISPIASSVLVSYTVMKSVRVPRTPRDHTVSATYNSGRCDGTSSVEESRVGSWPLTSRVSLPMLRSSMRSLE